MTRLSHPLQIACLLAALPFGCTREQPPPVPPAPAAPSAPLATPTPEVTPGPGAELPRVEGAEAPVSLALTSAQRDAAKRLNGFAVAFFKRIAQAEQNSAYSPASLATALHMLAEGARGSSLAELRSVLRAREDTSQAVAELARSWSAFAARDGATLSTANGLFPRKGFAPRPEYTEVLRARYGASVQALPFDTDPVESTRVINAWVKEHTRGRIDALLSGPLGADTVAVLTNAVYFKALWATRFSASQTTPQPFLVGGRNELDVPTMRVPTVVSTFTDADVTVLELP